MRERIAMTLDLSSCKDIREVFRELRTKMEWEDDCGENLDALWDILTGMPYRGDDFTIRRPRRFTGEASEPDEVLTAYVDRLCRVFAEAEAAYHCITVRLEYTDEGEAPSVQDSACGLS